jgi:hypothetical protein
VTFAGLGMMAHNHGVLGGAMFQVGGVFGIGLTVCGTADRRLRSETNAAHRTTRQNDLGAESNHPVRKPYAHSGRSFFSARAAAVFQS